MKTIIINGVSCTLSDRTIRAYERECAAIEAERKERELLREKELWLADPANWDSEIYSDIHKDVYGFRPRW